MASGWAGSTRKATLPPNWPTIRRAILTRDQHQCTANNHNGTRCTERATDVDHIGDPNNHDPSNLGALCSWHHDRKSSRQGNAARWARPRAKRPTERHPGII